MTTPEHQPSDSPEPLREAPGSAKWCQCDGAGSCMGCLIEDSIRRELGAAGITYLSERGHLVSPNAKLRDAGESGVEQT